MESRVSPVFPCIRNHFILLKHSEEHHSENSSFSGKIPSSFAVGATLEVFIRISIGLLVSRAPFDVFYILEVFPTPDYRMNRLPVFILSFFSFPLYLRVLKEPSRS
jgi:hypothetical protein